MVHRAPAIGEWSIADDADGRAFGVWAAALKLNGHGGLVAEWEAKAPVVFGRLVWHLLRRLALYWLADTRILQVYRKQALLRSRYCAADRATP